MVPIASHRWNLHSNLQHHRCLEKSFSAAQPTFKHDKLALPTRGAARSFLLQVSQGVRSALLLLYQEMSGDTMQVLVRRRNSDSAQTHGHHQLDLGSFWTSGVPEWDKAPVGRQARNPAVSQL